MQSFSRAGSDFFSEVGCPGASAQSNRDTGQTSMHTPSPVHTSQSIATLVPCMPCLLGGSTGPQTLWPLCSPTTCRLLWKSGSIGKRFTVLNSVKTANIRLSARSIIGGTHIISELELSQINNLNLAGLQTSLIKILAFAKFY